MTRVTALLMTLALPGAARAQQVTLTSHVSVQRSTKGPDGKLLVSSDEPKLVTPGDRLSFTLDYVNRTAKQAENFVVTDPLPGGVAFAGRESAGAEVSVDGGKTFGTLPALKVAGEAGKSRAAEMADVTHVRWRFGRPIAPGEHGQLRFEAIVK